MFAELPVNMPPTGAPAEACSWLANLFGFCKPLVIPVPPVQSSPPAPQTEAELEKPWTWSGANMSDFWRQYYEQQNAERTAYTEANKPKCAWYQTFSTDKGVCEFGNMTLWLVIGLGAVGVVAFRR